jgi:hypothetical protein
MNLIFCGNLGNGFVFFQQLLNHLGFEIRCMLSFHALIVSYPALFFGLDLWVHYSLPPGHAVPDAAFSIDAL